MKEGEKSLFFYASIIGLLGVAFFGAFSKKTRKEIGRRDKWSCVDCGLGFHSDDAMVHASHYNHDKRNPNYDTPRAGRIQCVDCHQQYHEDYIGAAQEIGLTERENMLAIAILSITPRGRTK